MSYTNFFYGFKKSVGINIKTFKYGLEVNVILLRLGIVAVFGQNNQITIVPLHHINISLQTIWSLESYVVPAKTKSGKTLSATEYSFLT
jgi:hypothetical protein